MSALWTAAEAAAATGGASSREWMATGVSIDSRSVAAGDLFVALVGPNNDGHDYVAAALERGAAAALVARRPEGLPADAPLLVVGDTQAGLEALGRAARARTAARVIGVTGSVGKTGTKEALKLALSEQGATIASAASFNNQWGVPLSLARMPRETRFGVFEIGMNHPGELSILTRQVRPHVAVVTTIAPAHLGHFASVDAIADAKAEIFEGVEPGGTAVLNRDNEYFERLASAARARAIGNIVGFGEAPGSEVRLLAVRLDPTSSEVRASVHRREIAYRIGTPGRHWVLNSLAVLAAAAAAGADPEAAAASLAKLTGLAGRGRRHAIRVKGGTAELIDESYNASPESMRAAFAVLGNAAVPPGGRRLAVLGDMLELGDRSERLHEELAGPLKKAFVNHVFTVGRHMKGLHDALPTEMRGGHAATSAEMARVVAGAVRPGDVVTVKGSLGSRMAEIVKVLLAGEDAPASGAAGK